MKQIYSLLSVFFFSLITLASNAQTTLAAGDIVIIGYNSDDNSINVPGGGYTDDDICFLLLTNIASGTEIYFTDLGWTGSGFQQNANNGCAVNSGAANDGCIRWTATSAMSAGTQVRIGCHFGLVATSGTVTGILQAPSGGTGGPGGTNPGYVSLATSSDEIFAFQGSLAAPTLIAAFHYGNNWASSLTTCQFTSTSSVDPGASVSGYSFLRSTTSPSEDGQYSGTMAGDAATIRTAVLNVANWTFNDATQFAFPIAGSFTLPVYLISFTGKNLPAGDYLEWEVENEENFSGYKVESSLDGVTFNFAGNVPAAGKHLYSFTVMPQLQKQHWYRLKMVDLDGSVSYSKTIRLQNTSAGQKLLIYPNPATEVLNISSTEKIIELRLSDASGRIYWQQKGNGMQTATVDIRSYAQGIYLLTVDTPTGKQTQRIIKSGK